MPSSCKRFFLIESIEIDHRSLINSVATYIVLEINNNAKCNLSSTYEIFFPKEFAEIDYRPLINSIVTYSINESNNNDELLLTNQANIYRIKYIISITSKQYH